MDNNIFKIVDSMLSDEELVTMNTKVLSLNFFQSQLNELNTPSLAEKHTSKIKAIKQILDDAYELDLYKFQFKILTEILSKEIANLQQEIAFGPN